MLIAFHMAMIATLLLLLEYIDLTESDALYVYTVNLRACLISFILHLSRLNAYIYFTLAN